MRNAASRVHSVGPVLPGMALIVVFGAQALAQIPTVAAGYSIDLLAGGVAISDLAFNGDGDLFAANGNTIWIFQEDFSSRILCRDPLLFDSEFPALISGEGQGNILRLDAGECFVRVTRAYSDGTVERVLDGVAVDFPVWGVGVGPASVPWNGDFFFPAVDPVSLWGGVLRVNKTEKTSQVFTTGILFHDGVAGCAFGFGDRLYLSTGSRIYQVNGDGTPDLFCEMAGEEQGGPARLSKLVFACGDPFGESLFAIAETGFEEDAETRLYRMDANGNAGLVADFGKQPFHGMAFLSGGKFPGGLYLAVGETVVRIRSSFLPIPTPLPESTPTPVPSLSLRLRRIPDLRLRVGTSYSSVLDLRDYVAETETPVDRLFWEWEGLGERRFSNVIRFPAQPEAGKEYELKICVSDGRQSAAEIATVKTSTFIVRPYQLSPVILHGLRPYRSTYLLNDFIDPQESIEVSSISWYSLPDSGPGFRVEIAEDSSFQVIPNGTPICEPVRLSFFVQAEPLETATKSETPTWTATPTAAFVPTSLPSPTPTDTRTPVTTWTASATPSATRSPTGTATRTRTPTSTPSPSATPTQGATATPSPTPIQVHTCDREFQLAFAGTFRTGDVPYDLKVGDFNEDGIADLVTADLNGNSLSLFLGLGTGGFQPVGAILTDAGPASIAVADMNRDGHPDLVVAHSYGQTLRLFAGDGRGRFSALGPVSIPPTADPDIGSGAPRLNLLAVGDFTGDGQLDAMVPSLEFEEDRLIVYRGDGSGLLEPVSYLVLPGAFGGLEATDFDGNGLEDLAVAVRRPYRITVYINRDGQFESTVSFATDDRVAGSYTRSLSVQDIDMDGHPDLAVSLFDGTRRLYYGRGNGTFGQAVLEGFLENALTESIRAADLDLNGVSDLILLNREIGTGGKQSIGIVCGSGPRIYEAAAVFRTERPASPFSRLPMVIADFNRDGRPDIAACDSASDDIFVFINRSGSE